MYGRGKMARRAVYTPGSVDSWDMENLNFLRKIRDSGKAEESDQETLSYVSDSDSAVYDRDSNVYGGAKNHGGDSESDYGSNTTTPQRLLDEALYSGGNGFALLNKSIVMKQMKSMAQSSIKDPYLEAEQDVISPLPVIHNKCGGPSAVQSNFDRRFMKGGRKPKGSLVTLGFMEPQLEDCYVLDVVTVRNESVLAECGVNDGRSGVLSEGDGSSTGIANALRREIHGSSAGESESESVSSEEFNSAREGFFPSPSVEDDDEPITIHRRDSSEEDINSSSECEPGISPVSVVVRGECATTGRLPATYPQSSERSFETASSNYYYLGQQQQIQEAHSNHPSMNSQQHQRDSLMTVETPRSISPYYVRLRRDLIPPSYTPPHPRQPWNFGMNRQGLLVIDYSPNWDGLETYMRNLSLG